MSRPKYHSELVPKKIADGPIEIEADHDSARLDSYLSHLVPNFSRSKIQALISEGHILWNQQKTRNNQAVTTGDKIQIQIPAAKPTQLLAQKIPIRIYYHDDHLAVLEKPAGLVVHPGAGNWDGTLVNALLDLFGEDFLKAGGINGEIRPGIVHRIDKNTSGILVIAKNQFTHEALSAQFKAHSIERRYRGLCYGRLPTTGDWKDSLARDPRDRKKFSVTKEGGKSAHTHFTNLATYTCFGPSYVSQFEAKLHTGRTHQIRVHFSAHGYGLVGDSTYNEKLRSNKTLKDKALAFSRRFNPELHALVQALEEKKRQFLHAYYLKFLHPDLNKEMEFVSEFPEDLQKILTMAETWKK